MAARKNLSHIDRTRQKIQASMLVNRLTLFVKGEVELSAAQVTAALGLIKKVIPDLSAVELSGEVNHHHSAYNLKVLDDGELDAVEAALAKAADASGSEGGASAAQAGSIH